MKDLLEFIAVASLIYVTPVTVANKLNQPDVLIESDTVKIINTDSIMEDMRQRTLKILVNTGDN